VEGVTLITGANGGLGNVVADHLLGTGTRNLAFHYRSSCQRITEDPRSHLFQAELTQENDVSRLRLEVEDRLGTVVGLVNLAGGSSNSMSWKMSLKEFNEILATNLTTVFLTCKEFIPGMRQSARGRIINTSSVVAFRGTVGAAHYAAAKAGIVGYSKALSLELAPKNITVNTLALGYFDAGIIEQVPLAMRKDLIASTPAKRLGKPEELGRCIEYLLSPGADFITGQTFHLNGGLY